MNNQIALLGWALWVSETWATWQKVAPKRQRMHARTRAVVIHDRVLNSEIPPGIA